MHSNFAITIGRQFGSGGKDIGTSLAKKLNIAYYDKELIKEASKESGFCEEIFENFDEKPTNSFLYSLVMDPYNSGFASNNFDVPLNHKVFLASYDTIKKLAEEKSCIFIGRCADYALENHENCLDIFITAPIKERIERVANRMELSVHKAKEIIQKTDKQRAAYYNYYTTKKWGSIESYDLCINSSLLGIDGTVEYIVDLVKRQNA